ncbi:lipopolysaccharide biosynthesis protein [Pseudochelatococcus sp. B33]
MPIRPLATRAVALLPLLGRYGAGMGVRGLEVVGKLGLYMLAAHSLGAHDAGLFFLCLTWAGLVSTVARMGLERALTRHIAAELAVGNGRAARADLLAGLLWTTLAGLAAGALTYGLARPAALYLFAEPSLAVPLKFAAFAIPPLTLTVVAGSVLAGLQRGVVAQLVQNALWPLLTLLALVAFAGRLDDLLMAMIAAMLAAGLFGLVLIVRRFRDDGDTAGGAESADDGVALPGLWRTARPLFVVEIIQVSLASLPMLALGVFASPTDVGAFSVALRISMLIWVVILSIGAMTAPSFAACHRRGELAELRRINRQTRSFVMLFGLPAIAVMLLFPATLLNLLGPGFDMASTALVIMAAGQLVNCLLPCQDIVLAMTGRGAHLRTLNIIQFATCIVLGVVLLPAFGMTGAALVTAISIAQGAIGTTLMLRRLMPGAF